MVSIIPKIGTPSFLANDDAIRSVSLILAVIADAIVESKGGIPVVAYTKDEGEDITMKEVIKQTDKENAEKLAKIRAERAARQEAYEREQALRNASHDKAAAVAKEQQELAKEEKKAEKPEKAEKAEKAEKPAPAKKPAAKKAPAKKEAPKAEEAK